jgi:hypothetical protein
MTQVQHFQMLQDNDILKTFSLCTHEIDDNPHPTRLGSSPSPEYSGEGRCERSERRGEGLWAVRQKLKFSLFWTRVVIKASSWLIDAILWI